jgi:TRAP-type C4-dicarboxylate transport system permease small subunit
MNPLKKLYALSGLLSGLFMILICLLILAQMVARLLGTLVPSSDELAAYAMAASGFLGLPYALERGAHIRVALLFKALPPRGRYLMEVLSTAVGLAICVYLAWYCARFTLDSYRFHDVSPGMLPIPLWIPQIAMLVGTLILVVAMGDRLVAMLRGRLFEPVGVDAVMSE